MRKKKAFRAFVYLVIGLGMLIYAIPRLPQVSTSLAGIYALVWLLFAMLLIAANLYALLRVDSSQKKERNWDQDWSRQVDRVSAKLYQERRRRRRSFLK